MMMTGLVRHARLRVMEVVASPSGLILADDFAALTRQGLSFEAAL